MIRFIFIFFLFCYPGSAFSKKKLIIAGAGPSTQIATLFMSEFTKSPLGEGIEFNIPRLSVKHAGAIKSTEKNLIGRTGRPLSKKEKDQGKFEIFLGKVPVGIVIGNKVKLKKLSLKQYQNIITSKITNWSKVGGANKSITLVGREPTEALFIQMKTKYPFYKKTKFNKIFKKDHQVRSFLNSDKGSYGIGFGSESYFKKNKLITINNFFVGGRIGFVYDKKNKGNIILKKIIEYAQSSEWREKAKINGYFPIKAENVHK